MVVVQFFVCIASDLTPSPLGGEVKGDTNEPQEHSPPSEEFVFSGTQGQVHGHASSSVSWSPRSVSCSIVWPIPITGGPTN